MAQLPATPIQQPQKIQFFEDATELSCRNKKCKAKWFQTVDRYRDNGVCPFCGIKIEWPYNTITRTKRRQIGGLFV